MKDLKLTNTIAISIPILLSFYGIIDEIGFFFAAFSTMLTGLLQIIIGIIFLIRFKNNIHIKIYFTLTILFFCLFVVFQCKHNLY